jgi:uncharacterized protein (TIGR03437 family)
MRSCLVLLSVLAGLAACGVNDDIPAPVLSSISPDHAAVGAAVTISGTNLCQQSTDGSGETDPLACAHTGSVSFGTMPATVTSYSDTSITATVPSVPAGDSPVSVATGGKTTNTVDFTAVEN